MIATPSAPSDTGNGRTATATAIDRWLRCRKADAARFAKATITSGTPASIRRRPIATPVGNGRLKAKTGERHPGGDRQDDDGLGDEDQ